MPARKKRVSLQTVARTAGRDRKFFRALVKNPRKALDSRGWILTTAQWGKLRRGLKRIGKRKGGILLVIIGPRPIWEIYGVKW